MSLDSAASNPAIIVANISGRSAGFHYEAIANWQNNSRFNAIDLVTSISLKAASIPISYPSVHPWFRNNRLLVRHWIGTTPQTPRYVDLYDSQNLIISGPTLASVLQTRLNATYAADGLTFVVAFDSVYSRLSITQTAVGFSFSFPVPAFDNSQQERDYFGVFNTLGLTCLAIDAAATAEFAVSGAGTDNNPIPPNTFFFSAMVDLIPVKRIRINVSEMPGLSTSSTSTSLACFSVPVLVPYGYLNVTTENGTFDHCIDTNPECAKFGNTRITLTTPEGNLIPFQSSYVDLDIALSTIKYASNKRHRVK